MSVGASEVTPRPARHCIKCRRNTREAFLDIYAKVGYLHMRGSAPAGSPEEAIAVLASFAEHNLGADAGEVEKLLEAARRKARGGYMDSSQEGK